MKVIVIYKTSKGEKEFYTAFRESEMHVAVNMVSRMKKRGQKCEIVECDMGEFDEDMQEMIYDCIEPIIED